MNIHDLLSSARLTQAERDAYAEVSVHVKSYLDNRGEFYGVTLSGHVLHELIESGEIEGHEQGGDTLGKYSSDLASALAKIEEQLPPANPLTVDESDPFETDEAEVV
jgi:hypothetical protein